MDLNKKKKWLWLLQPIENKILIPLWSGKQLNISNPVQFVAAVSWSVSYVFHLCIFSRFDSMIMFDLPDLQTRQEIIAQYAKQLSKPELVQLAQATEA